MENEKIGEQIVNKTTAETKNLTIAARVFRVATGKWEDLGVVSKSKVGLGIVNKIKQKLGIN